MLKTFLIKTKHLFAVLATTALASLFAVPTLASGIDICKIKLDKQTAMTEKDGIRFQAYVTQYKIGEQAVIFLPEEELEIPPKTGKPYESYRDTLDFNTFRRMTVYVRLTNCTSKAIRFGRFSLLQPVKLLNSNGEEIKPSSIESRPVDLSRTSVLVQPGGSLNLEMGGVLARDGDTLRLFLGRGVEGIATGFKQLYPGQTYQLQVTFRNDVDQVPIYLTDGEEIVEVWKGKVVLPPVRFRLAQPEE